MRTFNLTVVGRSECVNNLAVNALAQWGTSAQANNPADYLSQVSHQGSLRPALLCISS